MVPRALLQAIGPLVIILLYARTTAQVKFGMIGEHPKEISLF
tara:strand:+ start:447 stop:572 length:126 start_codon:yes stop_codon:yes gene_type:complete